MLFGGDTIFELSFMGRSGTVFHRRTRPAVCHCTHGDIYATYHTLLTSRGSATRRSKTEAPDYDVRQPAAPAPWIFEGDPQRGFRRAPAGSDIYVIREWGKAGLSVPVRAVLQHHLWDFKIERHNLRVRENLTPRYVPKVYLRMNKPNAVSSMMSEWSRLINVVQFKPCTSYSHGTICHMT
jgi:hypothetical protein